MPNLSRAALSDDPGPLVLVERDVPNPLRFEFAGTDLPFGRARTFAAFESGGKLIKERIDPPGSGNNPVFHVLVAPDRPVTIKGAFRDSQHAAVGHARDARDALMLLYRRSNLLDWTWGEERKIVLLDEPKFGEESPGDITYELTFEVANGGGPEGFVASDRARTERAPAPDPMPLIRAELAARRAELESLRMRSVARAAVLAIRQALDAADAACAAFQTANDALAFLDPRGGLAAAGRALGLSRGAQIALDEARGAYAQRRAADVVPSGDPALTVQWWQAQTAGETTCRTAHDTIRSARASVLTRLRSASRLYRVAEGDTLESIALSQLGSSARANELGIRQDQLVPGTYIRIPGAS